MEAKNISFIDNRMMKEALKRSFTMLNPKVQFKNPVMFVTYLCAIYTTCYALHESLHAVNWFDVQIAAWLWFTVLFANYAQAIAESRGKARCDT